MPRPLDLVLALAVGLSAAGSSRAAGSLMGGLRLQVATDGPMKGLVDASPLARSEVALRADPRTRAVVIYREGWRLTIDPRASETAYSASACAVLLRNGVPPTVVLEVAAVDGSLPTLRRTCGSAR